MQQNDWTWVYVLSVIVTFIVSLVIAFVSAYYIIRALIYVARALVIR